MTREWAAALALLASAGLAGATSSCAPLGDGYCIVGDDCGSAASTGTTTGSSETATSSSAPTGVGTNSSSPAGGHGGGPSSTGTGGGDGGAGGGCAPEPSSTTCSDGRCGTQTNNCDEEVVCSEDACAEPEQCGGGGEADACGGCDWSASYPAKAGCPDHEWWCGPNLPPTHEVRKDSDYVLLTLCGDDVVIDVATGLMWQRQELIADRHVNAVEKCAISSRAGFQDWRLPTRIELESLVDYKRAAGGLAILTPLFQGVQIDSLPASHNFTWTSTSSARAATPAFWVIDLRYGNTVPVDEPQECDIRCVR